MAFGEDKIGIGKSPFSRRANIMRRVQRQERGVVVAARPPRLWPMAENVTQNTAQDVNTLNMRTPLTSPSQNTGEGRVIGQRDNTGAIASIIFGSGPTEDNGNG